jgi:hypothetical protein
MVIPLATVRVHVVATDQHDGSLRLIEAAKDTGKRMAFRHRQAKKAHACLQLKLIRTVRRRHCTILDGQLLDLLEQLPLLVESEFASGRHCCSPNCSIRLLCLSGVFH